MAWPRGAALAEVAWAAEARPGFADFQRRLRLRREEPPGGGSVGWGVGGLGGVVGGGWVGGGGG